MGYELQAKVVPPIEPSLLQTALKERFGLHWDIVCEDRNIFSVTYAERVSND